jgi:hypothetical protein
MALNDIVITRGTGGLSRTLPGEDHISGFVFYNSTLATGNTIQHTFYSIIDAENTGITETSANYSVEWYQINEFFKMNPGGKLFVEIAPTGSTYDFEEVTDLQLYSAGSIRQCGVFNPGALSSGHTITLQGIADDNESDHIPLYIIYGANTKNLVYTALPSLHTLSTPCEQVSVVIGQDGGNAGQTLFASKGYSIPNVGAVLGAWSSANVSNSIAWVDKFNFVLGSIEMDEPAFGDGTKLSTLPRTTISAVNDLGYMFFLKHVGIGGTYLNDTFTATSLTDDYAYGENVRTIQKAVRNVRTILLPDLNSPLKVDPTSGKLDLMTIKYFENKAGGPLAQMQAENSISGYKVFVDPNQNVLSTSTLSVNIKMVPYGTARTINITIGYAVSI